MLFLPRNKINLINFSSLLNDQTLLFFYYGKTFIFRVKSFQLNDSLNQKYYIIIWIATLT